MHVNKWLSMIAALMLIGLIAACSPGATDGTAPPSGNEAGQPSPEPAETESPEPELTVEEQSEMAVLALKQRDMEALAFMVHPEKGVRFSPYAYIDPEKNLVMDAETIKGALDEDERRVWGDYDGSGEPIILTFADYFDKFVYDADFAVAPVIRVDEIVGQGNTESNLTETYPSPPHHFVEYHFDRIDPQYEGIDWRSLRLVFEEAGGVHWLVAIVHDQWTI